MEHLYVGDLSYFCTSEHIRKIFEDYGPLESATVRYSQRKGTTLHYGFVSLPAANAERAIEDLNRKLFMGRKLRVTYCTRMADEHDTTPQGVSIHVSFLTHSNIPVINEEYLHNVFDRCGGVMDIVIKHSIQEASQANQSSRKQHGYAFFLMDSSKSASGLLQHLQSVHTNCIDNVRYDGKITNVLRSKPRQPAEPYPSGTSTADKCVLYQDKLGDFSAPPSVNFQPQQSSNSFSHPEKQGTTLHMMTKESMKMNNGTMAFQGQVQQQQGAGMIYMFPTPTTYPPQWQPQQQQPMTFPVPLSVNNYGDSNVAPAPMISNNSIASSTSASSTSGYSNPSQSQPIPLTQPFPLAYLNQNPNNNNNNAYNGNNVMYATNTSSPLTSASTSPSQQPPMFQSQNNNTFNNIPATTNTTLNITKTNMSGSNVFLHQQQVPAHFCPTPAAQYSNPTSNSVNNMNNHNMNQMYFTVPPPSFIMPTMMQQVFYPAANTTTANYPPPPTMTIPLQQQPLHQSYHPSSNYSSNTYSNNNNNSNYQQNANVHFMPGQNISYPAQPMVMYSTATMH